MHYEPQFHQVHKLLECYKSMVKDIRAIAESKQAK